MNTELISRVQKVQNNLEYAQQELNSLTDILRESIKLSDEVFKQEEINAINSKLNSKINSLKYKIIPELKKNQ